MKRLILITACIACLFITACSKAQNGIDKHKILIVYLSRTNNTKAVAKMIHDYVGGTLTALELENPYPTDYQQTVQQVVRENETGYLPPLKTKIDSIENYDVIFVGFPTWAMRLPPPMKSFLHQYNLSGKTIIPFNTNAGYGFGSSIDTLQALCKQCNFLNAFQTTGGIERDGKLFVMKGEKEQQTKRDVKKWLETIKML